jgi:hypothetical protein
LPFAPQNRDLADEDAGCEQDVAVEFLEKWDAPPLVMDPIIEFGLACSQRDRR